METPYTPDDAVQNNEGHIFQVTHTPGEIVFAIYPRDTGHAMDLIPLAVFKTDPNSGRLFTVMLHDAIRRAEGR